MSRIAVPTGLTRVILGCVLVMSWAFAVAGEPVRVGILSPTSASAPSASVDAVTGALRELGYRHGENIVLESRYAEGKAERLPELAKELAALPVKVILAFGGDAIAASKNATSSIPIVIGTGGDFVALGWIASWDRPGGNVTGVQFPVIEAVRKRVDLFAHALGALSRLAVLVYAPYPPSPQFLHEAAAAAKERNIHVLPLKISTAEELEAAFREAQQSGAQAVMTLQAPFFFQQGKKIVELATQYKLPLAGGEPGVAEAGAMLQVGPDFPGCAAGAAVFVDRLLKGAQASELPVERCRRIEVVFNLKAARALGLTIAPTLTQGARVIE